MSEAKQPAVGLSKEDLIQVIEAVRKPVKSEKEIRDERVKEDERATMREIYAHKRLNKAELQNSCPHRHKTGVGSPVTYVHIAGSGRLYCQHCELWIFSTIHEAAQDGSLVAPEKHPALWNLHYDAALRAEAL